MSWNEQRRSALIRKLRELLGDDEAATLMESLHPEPWSEPTANTESDQRHFDVDSECARFDAAMQAGFAAQLEHFDAVLREQLDAQTKLLLVGMIGTLISFAGVMIGTAAV